MRAAVLIVSLVAAGLTGGETSNAPSETVSAFECDSSKLVLVRSRFWGTLERDGEGFSARELPGLYESSGYPDLARRHRRLNVLKWGGYGGCLTAMLVMMVTTEHHGAIDLCIGLSGLIPYGIASAKQKRIRIEFNGNICDRERDERP
ncbi:MAG: hypothetical protein GF331_11845 [Chitinivibrionales bacterium]|nr:hypothetical protein [Chitinivibrionales bacterium]